MGLSKLPKLSKAQGQPPAVNNPPVAEETTLNQGTSVTRIAPARPQPAAGFADVWISVGVGVFLLFWQPRFLQWLSSRLFHTHFDEFTLNDQIVPYQSLPEFWSDLGPTLFAFVLILDGILIIARRRSLVWIAFVLTIAATLFNLVWAVGSYAKYGMAPISFIAVIVGGFIAANQWRLLSTASQSQNV